MDHKKRRAHNDLENEEVYKSAGSEYIMNIVKSMETAAKQSGLKKRAPEEPSRSSKRYLPEKVFPLMNKCKRSMNYIKKNRCVPKPRAHLVPPVASSDQKKPTSVSHKRLSSQAQRDETLQKLVTKTSSSTKNLITDTFDKSLASCSHMKLPPQTTNLTKSKKRSFHTSENTVPLENVDGEQRISDTFSKTDNNDSSSDSDTFEKFLASQKKAKKKRMKDFSNREKQITEHKDMKHKQDGKRYKEKARKVKLTGKSGEHSNLKEQKNVKKKSDCPQKGENTDSDSMTCEFNETNFDSDSSEHTATFLGNSVSITPAKDKDNILDRTQCDRVLDNANLVKCSSMKAIDDDVEGSSSAQRRSTDRELNYHITKTKNSTQLNDVTTSDDECIVIDEKQPTSDPSTSTIVDLFSLDTTTTSFPTVSELPSDDLCPPPRKSNVTSSEDKEEETSDTTMNIQIVRIESLADQSTDLCERDQSSNSEQSGLCPEVLVSDPADKQPDPKNNGKEATSYDDDDCIIIDDDDDESTDADFKCDETMCHTKTVHEPPPDSQCSNQPVIPLDCVPNQDQEVIRNFTEPSKLFNALEKVDFDLLQQTLKTIKDPSMNTANSLTNFDCKDQTHRMSKSSVESRDPKLSENNTIDLCEEILPPDTKLLTLNTMKSEKQSPSRLESTQRNQTRSKTDISEGHLDCISTSALKVESKCLQSINNSLSAEESCKFNQSMCAVDEKVMETDIEGLCDELDIIATSHIYDLCIPEKKSALALYNLYKEEYKKFLTIKNTEEHATASLNLLRAGQESRLRHIGQSIKLLLSNDPCFQNLAYRVQLQNSTNSVTESCGELKSTTARAEPKKSTQEKVKKLCDECGKTGRGLCKGCRKKCYCSLECAESSWNKGHKDECICEAN